MLEFLCGYFLELDLFIKESLCLDWVLEAGNCHDFEIG